jgi:hypothetical protein
MSTPVPGEPSNVLPGPGRRPVSSEARAYCGPAHGMQWTVTGPEPPAWVELPWGTSSVLYRLVRRPHSDRPARDDLGYYLYVPLTGEWTEPAGDSGAQVIPLNAASSTRARRPAPGRTSPSPPPTSS